MPLPTIFLCTNTHSHSKHANCIFRITAEIEAALQGRYTIVRSIASDSTVILQQLQLLEEEIAIFHFDGHAHDFQRLLDAGQAMGIFLPSYLANLPHLGLVCLNYCSSPKFIDPLRDAGINTIVGSSHSQRYKQIVEFAVAFYRLLLLANRPPQVAYEEAIRIAEIQAGVQPYYAVFFHNRRDQSPQGDETIIIGLQTEEGQQHDDEAMPTPSPDPSSGASGPRTPSPPNIPPTSTSPPNTPAPNTPPSSALLSDVPASYASSLSNSSLPPLPPDLGLPNQPFPGANPYQRADARVFFGRNKEIVQLHHRLTLPTAPPLLLLHGQAGVGKSSLLTAGLLPRLEERYVIRQLTGSQIPRLYDALCQIVQSPSPAEITERFWSSLLTPQPQTILLVVDQIEMQLFSANASDQFDLAQFFTAVGMLLRTVSATTPHRIIFSLRETSLSRLYDLPFAPFLQSYAQDFALNRLDEMAVQNILDGFTQSLALSNRYQLTMENGLAQRVSTILAQDPNSSIAPFLQAILLRLWREALITTPRHLSLDRYNQLLGADTLLHAFLDAQLGELRNRRPPVVDSGQAVVLLAYHTSGLGAINGRTVEEIRHHLPEWNVRAISKLIALLTDLYLLTEVIGVGGQRTHLGHQLLAASLGHAQYPFTRYMERLRRLLTNLHFLPIRLQRSIAPELHRFLAELSQLYQEFVHPILQFFLRRIVVSLAFILIIFITLIILHVRTRTALQQIDAAPYIGQLTYPQLFVLSPVNREENRWEKITEFIGGVDPLRFGIDVKVTRINLLHARKSMPVAYEDQGIRSLAFSPDSQLLFAANYDNNIEAWSLATAQAHPSLPTLTNTTHLIVMDSQGRFLVYGGTDGRVGLIRLNPREDDELPPHNGPVTSVQVSGDGGTILTSGSDGAIHQYNVNTAQTSILKCNSIKPIVALAIHPGNRVIACANTSRIIYLVDTNTGQTLYHFAGHFADIKWLAFSPDGDYLLSAGYDETVRVWQLSTGAEVHKFTDSTAAVNAAHYSPDGTLIIAAGDDGLIRIWDAVTYQLLEVITAHSTGVSALAIRADGKQIASAGWNGELTLWDIGFAASRVAR